MPSTVTDLTLMIGLWATIGFFLGRSRWRV